MEDAPKLLPEDTLRQAYPKVNEAIDMVNNFQEQIDQLVIEGDSSVEAAQARVSISGETHTTLKERLDTEYSKVTSDLAQIAINVENFPIQVPEVDDTGRLQRAIDFAISQKKRLALAPYKTYLISNALEATGNLIFIGLNSTIKLNASTEFIFKIFQNQHYEIHIDGIIFDGNNLNTGNGLLYILGTNKFIFRNNKLINSATNGLWLFDNNTNSIIENNIVDNIEYTGILVEGAQVGTENYPTVQEVNTIIKGNIISNCKIHNGIFVSHALKKIVISDNIIKNIGDEGIEVGGAAGAYGTQEVVITNNVIENPTGAGVIVRNSKYVTVSNVTVKGSIMHGLQILDSNHVTANNLVLINCGESSINISNSSHIQIQALIKNDTTNYALHIFNGRHIQVVLDDDSEVAQRINHDHVIPQSELILNHFEYRSKVMPIFDVLKWGIYYRIATRTGHYDTNIFNENIVRNSLFLGNSLEGWEQEPDLTAIANDNTVIVTSTQDFRKFYTIINGVAKYFKNQYILEFDYQTQNNDSIVYVENTDGTNIGSLFSKSLPSSIDTFTNMMIIGEIHDLYPNVKLSFVPRSNGGSDGIMIKNIKLISPYATDKLGSIDKKIM